MKLIDGMEKQLDEKFDREEIKNAQEIIRKSGGTLSSRIEIFQSFTTSAVSFNCQRLLYTK